MRTLRDSVASVPAQEEDRGRRDYRRAFDRDHRPVEALKASLAGANVAVGGRASGGKPARLAASREAEDGKKAGGQRAACRGRSGWPGRHPPRS